MSGSDETLEADLIGFGQKKKARVTTLWHDDVTVINEIDVRAGKVHNIEPVESEIRIQDNVLRAPVKNNSVSVYVIE